MSQSLSFPAQPEPPVEQQSPNRRSEIRPGIGCVHLVYRDEDGFPLLNWECDYRLSDETRAWLQRIQQSVGDQLPSAIPRTAPLLAPRLLR